MLERRQAPQPGVPAPAVPVPPVSVPSAQDQVPGQPVTVPSQAPGQPPVIPSQDPVVGQPVATKEQPVVVPTEQPVIPTEQLKVSTKEPVAQPSAIPGVPGTVVGEKNASVVGQETIPSVIGEKTASDVETTLSVVGPTAIVGPTASSLVGQTTPPVAGQETALVSGEKTASVAGQTASVIGQNTSLGVPGASGVGETKSEIPSVAPIVPTTTRTDLPTKTEFVVGQGTSLIFGQGPTAIVRGNSSLVGQGNATSVDAGNPGVVATVTNTTNSLSGVPTRITPVVPGGIKSADGEVTKSIVGLNTTASAIPRLTEGNKTSLDGGATKGASGSPTGTPITTVISGVTTVLTASTAVDPTPKNGEANQARNSTVTTSSEPPAATSTLRVEPTGASSLNNPVVSSSDVTSIDASSSKYASVSEEPFTDDLLHSGLDDVGHDKHGRV